MNQWEIHEETRTGWRLLTSENSIMEAIAEAKSILEDSTRVRLLVSWPDPGEPPKGIIVEINRDRGTFEVYDA